jgi:hypothetical protein
MASAEATTIAASPTVEITETILEETIVTRSTLELVEVHSKPVVYTRN